MPRSRSSPPKVAVLIETSTAYGRGLLRGISRFANAEGKWALYLKPSGKDGALKNLKDWNVDGILVRVHHRHLADQVLGAGLPVVDLGYAIPDLFPWKISNDQTLVGQAAVEHLVDCGLRNFAFCGWGPAHPTADIWERVRMESARRLLHARGFGLSVYEWPRRTADRAWGAAQKHLAAWLGSLPKPVGLIAANDERALEILDAAQGAGIAVPDEIALVGVDNDEVLCEAANPSLSSVALNLERIGYEGARLLDRLMKGRSYPRRPLLIPPVRVAVRASTDVVATVDEVVAAAVRFIRKNLHRAVNVDDVLGEVHVSRKTLELRFQRELQRSPYEEIQRRRMLRVKELLSQTDWSMKRIAAECGFRHVENLYSVFRREVGRTPGKFRTEHAPNRVPYR
jgi:LacI family transcriptional regulator